MICLDQEMRPEELLEAAKMICMAARTAPKGRGFDFLKTAILTEEDKAKLAARMRDIAKRDNLAFFERDAGNVEQAGVLLLFGTRAQPLGLNGCGFCGRASCGDLATDGGLCAFNSGDLGIAVGSAASRAADLRIDNRILYSAGRAALELGIMGDDVRMILGMPLSVSGKSPFFDR